MFAALFLPILVPGIITLFIWALPGDPASIICPPEQCPTEVLAKEFNLDKGSWVFYSDWLSNAMGGEFGRSWRVMQGVEIQELLLEAIPNTFFLLLFSLFPISLGAFLGAMGTPRAKWDPLLIAGGIVPVVVFALISAAVVEINYAGSDLEQEANWVRILMGAFTLGFADAAFSGSLIGVRETFSREKNQRYVGVSILRGETVLSNTLPNVSNAIIGQYRARILHILSGLVIVEVIVGVNGVGSLLWKGTLKQDFGLVLATATIFAGISALLLVVQAFFECVVAMHVRRVPRDVQLGESA
jgi:ABC-type dipeptide/oligopeptide/nickel transport system permease component